MKFKLFLLLLLFSCFKIHGQKAIYEYLKQETSEYRKGKLVSELRKSQQSGANLLIKWIDTGKSLVFPYERIFDDPKIFDEEIQTTLDFEVPASVKKFHLIFSHSDLLKPPVFYTEIGLGWPSYRYLLNSANGFIAGELKGDIWEIQGDLELNTIRPSDLSETKFPVQFSKFFIPKHKKNKKK